MQANLKSAIDKGTDNVKKFMDNLVDSTNDYASIPNVSIPGGTHDNGSTNIILTTLKEVKSNIMRVAQEDPRSYRIKIIVAAILMVFSAFLDIIYSALTFSTHGVFVALYFLLFGAIICFFEGETFLIRIEWIEQFKNLAKVFDYTFTKGAFLLLGGFFQYVQRNNFLDVFSGAWSMFIGATSMMVGASAGKKLAGLHGIYRNKGEAKNDFTIFDTDEDGLLGREDFLGLCQSKGIVMTNNEVDACFGIMTKNSLGKISSKDFSLWYEVWIELEDDQII